MFHTQRANYKQFLARSLPSHPTIAWTASAIPTIRNPAEVLHGPLSAACTHWTIALRNNSEGSALDGAHGNWEPVVAHLVRSTPLTIAAKSQAFVQHVIPLGSAKGTRLKAWRNWCTVLTWAMSLWPTKLWTRS